MYNKAEIVFTFPTAMGGVASFNFNIINFASLRKQFYIKVILLQVLEDNRPNFKDHFEVDAFTIFSYSNKENQYLVAKRLEALIGKKHGAVVCDNSITLQACSIFKNPKTIFHLLHDYFYVNQNIQFGRNIDVAVAHCRFFADCVFAANPIQFEGRNFYIPYGVMQYETMPVKQQHQNLKLFFLGRLEASKGLPLLFNIEEALTKRNISVDWTIIGKGQLEKALKEQWRKNKNVQFEQPENTKAIYALLKSQDVFIFPTTFEGTPVSILEAISNAAVIIVSDLPGGIRDIVTPDIGFRLPLHNVEAFAEAIEHLEKDRVLLKKMQENAWLKAKHHHDISLNANLYFELFGRYASFKRTEPDKSLVPLSRLDKKLIPNFFVKLIRRIF